MKPPKEPSLAKPSTLAWWSRRAFVYFIAAGSPPVAVKIGMTTVSESAGPRASIRRRLDAIQSSNHERVELLGVVAFDSGDYPARDSEINERELHVRFAQLARFRKESRGAEWFTATAELLAFVQGVATRPEGLDLPRFATEKR